MAWSVASIRWRAHRRSLLSSRVFREELDLGDHGSFELAEQHALVGRVQVAEGVLRAEEQDLGVRHRLVERAGQGDGAAHGHVHRLAAPGRAQRSGGGLVGGPARGRGEAVAGRARRRRAERDPERAHGLEVADQRLLRLGGTLLRMDAQVELRARVRHDGVDGLVDGRGVDADDRDRRARPQALAEAARPEQRHPGLDAGDGAELLVGVRGSEPRRTAQARDRHVPVLVVQGRQGVEQRDQGVRGGAAERAAVPGLGQRPDLDDDLGVTP